MHLPHATHGILHFLFGGKTDVTPFKVHNIFKAGMAHLGDFKRTGMFTAGFEAISHAAAGVAGYAGAPAILGGLGFAVAGPVGAVVGVGVGARASFRAMGKWSTHQMHGEVSTGIGEQVSKFSFQPLDKLAATRGGQAATAHAKKFLGEVDDWQQGGGRVRKFMFPYKKLPKDDLRRYAPHAGIGLAAMAGADLLHHGSELMKTVYNMNAAPPPTASYDSLMSEIRSGQSLSNSTRR